MCVVLKLSCMHVGVQSSLINLPFSIHVVLIKSFPQLAGNVKVVGCIVSFPKIPDNPPDSRLIQDTSLALDTR